MDNYRESHFYQSKRFKCSYSHNYWWIRVILIQIFLPKINILENELPEFSSHWRIIQGTETLSRFGTIVWVENVSHIWKWISQSNCRLELPYYSIFNQRFIKRIKNYQYEGQYFTYLQNIYKKISLAKYLIILSYFLSRG